MMDKELHLIVLWQNARYKQKEILDDIQQNLKILECIEIEWTPENVASNFTRFYGVKLPNRSFKEKECGSGKFLLVLVEDENPNYDFVETSRGSEYVNVDLFNLKEKYRFWTRGGHKIHATNTPEETNHDITLLLGVNYEDYLKTAPEKWNGQIKSIKRDISGCNGWSDVKELFYVLNSTIKYCVLRNFEILPDAFKSDLHGDIDILTDNYQDIIYLTGAEPVFKKKYRVHHKVKIGGNDVLFDFRFLGDNYYCCDFENDILENRILNEKGIYIPNYKNAFFSLVYHCVMHKIKIAVDYYEKAENLFKKAGLDKNYQLQDYSHPFDLYYKLLIDFMNENHYEFVKPNDLSVYYNKKYTNYNKISKWLNKNYFITDLTPYMVNLNGFESDYIYFIGICKGNSLFIKWGGRGRSAVIEYKACKKLYDANNKNFIKPIFYKADGENKFAAFEYIDGVTLDNIAQDITNEQKTNIVVQLEDIAKTLLETKIIHRDVRPSNLILGKDGVLKLFDSQFAINSQKYRELGYVRKQPFFIHRLGDVYNPGAYIWDDIYALNKIVGELDAQSTFIEKNVGKLRSTNRTYKVLYNTYNFIRPFLRLFKPLIRR